jgi:hypothetical protein
MNTIVGIAVKAGDITILVGAVPTVVLAARAAADIVTVPNRKVVILFPKVEDEPIRTPALLTFREPVETFTLKPSVSVIVIPVPLTALI